MSTHQQILFKHVQGSYVHLTPEVSTWKHLHTQRISASSFTAAVIGPSLSTLFHAIHNSTRLQPSVRPSNWKWSSIGKCTLIKINRSLDIWELNYLKGSTLMSRLFSDFPLLMYYVCLTMFSLNKIKGHLLLIQNIFALIRHIHTHRGGGGRKGRNRVI